MPTWLRRQLEQGAKVTIFNRLNGDGKLVRVEQIANETRGLLPVLAQLCEQDRSLSKVYLCHPDVQHVVKMAREGGFCGYRNIQMLVRYLLICDSSWLCSGKFVKVRSAENLHRSRLFKVQMLREANIFRAGSQQYSSYKI